MDSISLERGLLQFEQIPFMLFISNISIGKTNSCTIGELGGYFLKKASAADHIYLEYVQVIGEFPDFDDLSGKWLVA